MKVINLHVALALFYYVQRQEAKYGNWGDATAQDVMEKITELSDKSQNIKLSEVNHWLSTQKSGKMAAGCDGYIFALMSLNKKAAQ